MRSWVKHLKTELEQAWSLEDGPGEPAAGPYAGLVNAGMRFALDSPAPALVRSELEYLAWNYCVVASRLHPRLASVYVPADFDEETVGFVQAQTQAWWLDRRARAMAADVLLPFMSLTDVNGILGRGHMLVLTSDLTRRLVRAASLAAGSQGSAGVPEPLEAGAAAARTLARAEEPAATAAGPPATRPHSRGWSRSRRDSGRRLLDIGAGDGAATSRVLAALDVRPDDVVATEASAPMVRALAARGFEAIETTRLDEGPLAEPGQFDVVLALNVLDRTDDPAALLGDVRRHLAPGGVAVVAVVLPFRPMVEDGATKRDPAVPLRLPRAAATPGVAFEDSATMLLAHAIHPAVSARGGITDGWPRAHPLCLLTLRPAHPALLPSQGLEPVAFTSVPYLCEGDGRATLFALRDAVFVLRACEPVAPPGVGVPAVPE